MVWVNYGLLCFGLLAQSLLEIISLDNNIRFDIINRGLLVWMATPYLLMFFVNKHISQTETARNLVTYGILVLVMISFFASLLGAVATQEDAVGILIFCFIPFIEMRIQLISATESTKFW